MSDDATHDTAVAKNGWRPQLTILTMLLLMACVATWTAYVLARQETTRLQLELPGLRSVARELIVNDPAQIAVVSRHPKWYDEHIWNIYIPSNRSYELCLMLDKVNPNARRDEFPKVPEHMVAIDSGRSSVEIRHENTNGVATTQVLVNEKVVLNVSRPVDWGGGSSGTGHTGESRQSESDKPFQLFRRIFELEREDGSDLYPDFPSYGLLLWLRPSAG